MSYVKFEDMIGKVFTEVRQDGNDAIYFKVSDSEEYVMLYHQDCCASCVIEDVVGDLQDLVGSPIVRAEENGSEEVEPEQPKDQHYVDDSFTWTFYRIGTIKGTVVIRWYGSSNGYYSESASFERVQ